MDLTPTKMTLIFFSKYLDWGALLLSFLLKKNFLFTFFINFFFINCQQSQYQKVFTDKDLTALM